MAKSEKQKMLAGELYSAQDAELQAESWKAQRLLLRYNRSEPEEREALLRALLGSCGEGVVVKPSFQCDYGYNIHLERGVFLNFSCVLLDVTPIRIGGGT